MNRVASQFSPFPLHSFVSIFNSFGSSSLINSAKMLNYTNTAMYSVFKLSKHLWTELLYCLIVRQIEKFGVITVSWYHETQDNARSLTNQSRRPCYSIGNAKVKWLWWIFMSHLSLQRLTYFSFTLQRGMTVCSNILEVNKESWKGKKAQL